MSVRPYKILRSYEFFSVAFYDRHLIFMVMKFFFGPSNFVTYNFLFKGNDENKTPTRRSQRSAVVRKPDTPSTPSTPSARGGGAGGRGGRGRGGMRGGGVSRGRGGGGAGTPNRPQRTRKLPVHLADDQFESPLSKGGLIFIILNSKATL